MDWSQILESGVGNGDGNISFMRLRAWGRKSAHENFFWSSKSGLLTLCIVSWNV